MSFIKRFFERASERPSAEMSMSEAMDVVGAYGSVLEHDAPAPGTVADVRKLPYPKNKIKKALVLAFRATSDSYMKEQLKAAYVALANWQEGVGEVHAGRDRTKLDRSTDSGKPAEQAAQMAQFERWAPIIEAEREELRSELDSLCL